MKGYYKISIGVPIYNVESYIERCVKSLFEQTYENIEYIFVDDCSQDNSLGILQETLNHYPQRKNEVKIIQHKTNKGVSTARNEMLKNFTGVFFSFVDADDYLPVDAIEKLVSKQKETNADIVTGSIRKITRKKDIIIKEPFFSSTNDMLYHIISQPQNHENVARIIKTEIIKSNSLKYQSQIKIGEDWIMLAQIVRHAKKVAQIEDIVYVYDYTNSSSAMHNITDIKYKWNLADIIALSEIKKELVEMPLKYMIAINHLILKKADDGLLGAAKLKDKETFNKMANYVKTINQQQLKQYCFRIYSLFGRPNYTLCSMCIAISFLKKKSLNTLSKIKKVF